ncbi:hypothetical protein C8J56DRAFT_1048802 [Mycena floridula]|nr:hypothetical protein C8J56DRAFT_1048802 [Mycena floridula]
MLYSITSITSCFFSMVAWIWSCILNPVLCIPWSIVSFCFSFFLPVLSIVGQLVIVFIGACLVFFVTVLLLPKSEKFYREEAERKAGLSTSRQQRDSISSATSDSSATSYSSATSESTLWSEEDDEATSNKIIEDSEMETRVKFVNLINRIIGKQLQASEMTSVEIPKNKSDVIEVQEDVIVVARREENVQFRSIVHMLMGNLRQIEVGSEKVVRPGLLRKNAMRIAPSSEKNMPLSPRRRSITKRLKGIFTPQNSISV